MTVNRRKRKSAKLWSVTRIQDPRFDGITVRVAEWEPGGFLHVIRWVPPRNGEAGRQESRSLGYRRTQLGTTPREQERMARRLGIAEIEKLATREENRAPAPSAMPVDTLTISQLHAHYKERGLKRCTKGYRRDALKAIEKVAEGMKDKRVVDIRPSDLEAYMAKSIARGHGPAGRYHLVALSIAINWAIGEELLSRNPLTATTRAREAMRLVHRPRHAVADPARYEALRAVAAEYPPQFRVLLSLAWHTGHRLSALLQLKWSHISFKQTDEYDHGSIRWYADAHPDRKKHEHVVGMNAEARAALLEWRSHSNAFGAWVFPSSRKGFDGPLTSTYPKRWLRDAEKEAGLEHQAHGGWHAFRRGWVTQRKHLPLKDVAAAGGWTDTDTVVRSYLHTTAEASREVANYVA